MQPRRDDDHSVADPDDAPPRATDAPNATEGARKAAGASPVYATGHEDDDNEEEEEEAIRAHVAKTLDKSLRGRKGRPSASAAPSAAAAAAAAAATTTTTTSSRRVDIFCAELILSNPHCFCSAPKQPGETLCSPCHRRLQVDAGGSPGPLRDALLSSHLRNFSLRRRRSGKVGDGGGDHNGYEGHDDTGPPAAASRTAPAMTTATTAAAAAPARPPSAWSRVRDKWRSRTAGSSSSSSNSRSRGQRHQKRGEFDRTQMYGPAHGSAGKAAGAHASSSKSSAGKDDDDDDDDDDTLEAQFSDGDDSRGGGGKPQVTVDERAARLRRAQKLLRHQQGPG